MMMKTSLCSGILHWHRGSTGAVMTRGKDMVIIRTEDNKKADKDSRQELVYPGEIMQKVCQNWADWRSVRGSGSPANEPDLCPPSNLCLLLCSMPAFSWCCRIRRTSDPATGFLAVCPSRQWGLGLLPTILKILWLFFNQKMHDTASSKCRYFSNQQECDQTFRFQLPSCCSFCFTSIPVFSWGHPFLPPRIKRCWSDGQRCIRVLLQEPGLSLRSNRCPSYGQDTSINICSKSIYALHKHFYCLYSIHPIVKWVLRCTEEIRSLKGE